MKNNRNELYNLSNQMIELFIKDIFSKNKTDLEKAKANLSDEQRETLKQSVTHLQGQVESFIHDQNASKTITENDQIKNSASASPLRGKLRNRKDSDGDTEREEKEE